MRMFAALGPKILHGFGNLTIGLMQEPQNQFQTNIFDACVPKLTFRREKKNTLKGLIVIHSAIPKAFYLVMDVQPFYKSENK